MINLKQELIRIADKQDANDPDNIEGELEKLIKSRATEIALEFFTELQKGLLLTEDKFEFLLKTICEFEGITHAKIELDALVKEGL